MHHMAEVSHQPPGSDAKMSGTPQAGKERERREGDNIYHSHPIPSMPPLLTRPRPPPDSMLDYTARMRQISKVRADPLVGDADSSPQTVLEVQAHHIPKARQGQLRHGDLRPSPRRPLSLDELIGRRGKKDEASITDTKRKDRCMSEPVVIPSHSSRREKEKEEKRIRINFVSTADLFDLVDFSLRSKRSANIHLARVEDTLRMIKEANFFRSISSRRKMKPGSEKESDVDTASLIVQGTSSPRESSQYSPEEARDREEEESDRNEMLAHKDPYDSDDEDDENDNAAVDWDFDQLQDRRHMLLQPPKLHYRPKRAKRMKLHRSLLSAIPEDELTQRPPNRPALVPDNFGRIPVMPTSSSLTAIKGSKQPELLSLPDPVAKKTVDRMYSKTQKASVDDLSLPHTPSVHAQETSTSKSRHPKTYTDSAENRTQERSADRERSDHPHTVKVNHSHSTKKKHSPRRTAADLKTPSLRGRSMLLEAQDTRHKKVRKIIFLRDLPEQSPHRC